jgi:transcriptional regulator with XRE-family HTH domain
MVSAAVPQRQRAIGSRFESEAVCGQARAAPCLKLYFSRFRAGRDGGTLKRMAVTELQLGPRIRSLRQARKVTLRELAGRAGVTESFLSQVEREVTSPSIASVQRIARALDLGIADLFADEAPLGRVVRRADRRRIAYQGLNATDEFLTAGRDGRLQVILTTIETGGGTGDEAYTHESDEEVVIVLEGRLELWVGDEHHALEAGDTITHSSRQPHHNRNPGPGRAVVLFCSTPPSF